MTLSGSNGWASPDLPASDILNFICKWQHGCSLWLQFIAVTCYYDPVLGGGILE